jgi:hypothetical protein
MRKSPMTEAERSVLETLDEIVRSDRVRTQLLPIIERIRAELARRSDALMTWEPVPLDTFDDRLPPSIKSGWVFVLRAGTDTGFERHPNSHQRMVTLAGTGDMKTDAKGMPNDVKEESEIVGQSHALVSDAGAALERRWISIPKNVWHRSVIPKGADWLVVSFHTVPPEELIEERPGGKRMWYESERKRAG